MPLYLAQASYTPEAWAALARSPEDREQTFRALVEGLGGRVHSFHFSLGEYDVVTIYEVADQARATAVAIAANSAGHLRTMKTTVLTSVDEAMEAMRAAGAIAYRPPSPREYPLETGVYEGAQGDTSYQFGTLTEAVAAMEAAARHIAGHAGQPPPR